uniref:Uncharacterized protein n=1 Tax=Octopus bimaculoides TaxID=37653 RepID=A0A0L8HDS6_OCTBM
MGQASLVSKHSVSKFTIMDVTVFNWWMVHISLSSYCQNPANAYVRLLPLRCL